MQYLQLHLLNLDLICSWQLKKPFNMGWWSRLPRHISVDARRLLLDTRLAYPASSSSSRSGNSTLYVSNGLATGAKFSHSLRWQVNAWMSTRNAPANLQSEAILDSVCIPPTYHPITQSRIATILLAHQPLTISIAVLRSFVIFNEYSFLVQKALSILDLVVCWLKTVF